MCAPKAVNRLIDERVIPMIGLGSADFLESTFSGLRTADCKRHRFARLDGFLGHEPASSSLVFTAEQPFIPERKLGRSSDLPPSAPCVYPHQSRSPDAPIPSSRCADPLGIIAKFKSFSP